MKTINKCKCGRRCSKYANECRKCHKAHMDKLHEEAGRIVDSGTCPDCGAGIKRNLALAGWFQCEQFGAEGFRKDSDKPSCNFQTFTE